MQPTFSIRPNNSDNIIKILWWSVNRRNDTVLQNVFPITTQKPKIIFLTETAIGYEIIPEIDVNAGTPLPDVIKAELYQNNARVGTDNYANLPLNVSPPPLNKVI